MCFFEAFERYVFPYISIGTELLWPEIAYFGFKGQPSQRQYRTET